MTNRPVFRHTREIQQYRQKERLNAGLAKLNKQISEPKDKPNDKKNEPILEVPNDTALS